MPGSSAANSAMVMFRQVTNPTERWIRFSWDPFRPVPRPFDPFRAICRIGFLEFWAWAADRIYAIYRPGLHNEPPTLNLIHQQRANHRPVEYRLSMGSAGRRAPRGCHHGPAGGFFRDQIEAVRIGPFWRSGEHVPAG